MPKSDIRDTVVRDLLRRKPMFTSADALALTRGRPTHVSRTLTQMAARGALAKVTRGVWANTAHPMFSPYLMVGYLHARWSVPLYVTSATALHLHGMLSQIPREIHLATTRPRPILRTSIGTYVFHGMPVALLSGTEPGDEWGRFERATPEKALFDTVYLSLHRGKLWRHLPEIELSSGWSWDAWTPWLGKIKFLPVRRAMETARERMASTLTEG
ncbi:MAG: hypothetical protein ABIZ71_12300 [Gemmatimonadales bacterium]